MFGLSNESNSFLFRTIWKSLGFWLKVILSRHHLSTDICCENATASEMKSSCVRGVHKKMTANM